MENTYSSVYRHTVCPRWSWITRLCDRATHQARTTSPSHSGKVIAIVAVWLWLVGAIILARPAFAQSSSVSIEPAFQELVISDDKPTQKTSFRLINNTEQVQEFTLLPIDIRQTDDRGNITFVDKPAGNVYTLASFIEVPQESIQINPGEKKEVTITIKNSQDISPGGHYGAVIARFASEDSQGNQKILPAVSSLLFVRKIGGERFHISLKESSFGSQTFVFSIPKTIELIFDNQGNTHITPYGQVKLSDLFGNPIYEGTINEASTPVLPQVGRRIQVPLRQIRKTLPLQLYQLSISGKTTPGDVTFSQTQSFLYVSRTALLSLSVVIGTLSVLIAIHISTRRKKLRS